MNALSRAIAYIPKRAICVSQLAYTRYRFYLYWRAQERMARRYSPDRLRAIQWRKFTDLLEFAYNRVPFYKDRFRQAGITPESIKNREDLLRIPPLTKDDVRQNFPDRILDNSRKYPPSRIGRTSGSTGESLHFVSPDDGWTRNLYYSIHLRTRGLSNLPILVHTTPHCTASCSLQVDDDVRGVKKRQLQQIWFLRHLDGLIGLPSSHNILSAPDEYMERLAEIISCYSPCMVIVDPVYFGSFARYLKKSMRSIPDIRNIITTYELLTGSLKELLHEVFGCDIHTQYGASEIPDIASECAYHTLHVRTNTILLEAIRNGRPAAPGEIGRGIVTDLSNYNMPFIRYDIGDVIAPGDGRCRCGRNTETIDAVHGRVCDIIKANGANGASLLSPLQVDEIFRGLRGIAAYRLVQREKNLYQIAIMPDGHRAELDKHMLIKRCRSMFGGESQFEIEFVEEIKPLASNKYRFIYSHMPTVDL